MSARQLADTVPLPRGPMDREELTAFLLGLFEEFNGFCLDNIAERSALADIVAVELLAKDSGTGFDHMRRMLRPEVL